MQFSTNQIVKGKVCGVFVVLGETTVAGEPMYVVKPVNHADLSQVGRGELCLPADSLKPYNEA